MGLLALLQRPFLTRGGEFTRRYTVGAQFAEGRKECVNRTAYNMQLHSILANSYRSRRKNNVSLFVVPVVMHLRIQK